MAHETRGSWLDASNPAYDDPVLEEDEHEDEDNVSSKSLNRKLEDNLNMVDTKRCGSSSHLELSRSQSPIIKKNTSQSPDLEKNETIESKIKDFSAPERTSKLPRIFQRGSTRTTPLLHDLPDVMDEAVSSFQVIKECIYGSKYMGSSGDHDALDCDCSEEWKLGNGKNHACGEDSDCINRATKMECVDGQCNCGIGCQNTRFQNRIYADVSVVKTDKKGYGLRANTDLNPNDFIFEYIGEVINEPTFRRRTIQYNDEGIKHFYFMSLTKNEFIDATKKGNLGRFCNHSCNPNCYVDKWVVGAKLRMGVFAERFIAAGEELVFNYNVDRYGADPQPCYCEEFNCTGFIGGKTQTERATKLPHTTIEALGIDDNDGWDLTVSKKPRKKKSNEDDEEYVNSVQPKALDEEGVRKVMAILMQCKEKWIAVKLLSRLQRCNDQKVRNRVVQMHGYQILRTTLMTWEDDNNIILQILDILYKLPRLTRNKISDSKIEAVIEKFVDSQHEDISYESKRLLELWSKLEVAYRIPRKKFDPNAVTLFERRNVDRPDESTKSSSATTILAPSGPRGSTFLRPGISTGRPSIRRSFKALPSGWFTAKDENGKTYYYSKSGQTTWVRPSYPAEEQPQPPKGPTKSVQTAKAIQDIIDSITKSDPNVNVSDRHALSTEHTNTREKKVSSEKWRSLPKEKQMKLYENTLFPHIKYVMQKFHHKLPKEDLKKFAKEVGKKLVASDFKNDRVEDPTKISTRQEKKVKSYVRAYFEKAVAKKAELDRRKKEKERIAKLSNGDLKETIDICSPGVKEEEETFDILSPSSPRDNSPGTPLMKRKRDENSETSSGVEILEPSKKLKDEAVESIPTPPPPPPPPSGQKHNHCDEDQDIMDDEISVSQIEAEEKIQLRLQEEDLMRENEEAERLEKKDGTKEIALIHNQNEIRMKLEKDLSMAV
ncbi:Histone-lysine N-methyltransferase, H3 lysine-36 specific [Golovinomyces cichoracearum]|uniref:Histone-lysine N-methyltransferase, H3 lysine-36 specific n=1 Tax=Golovinomyces cichoracearum TaxID=62708 RepID=A0A420IWY0_9PEZI|nr:Histone-lysine N-methyltransferase, H3 lysine-36 specific [Golovinomyces cichoracearum]